jgi:hypothetical protein
MSQYEEFVKVLLGENYIDAQSLINCARILVFLKFEGFDLNLSQKALNKKIAGLDPALAKNYLYIVAMVGITKGNKFLQAINKMDSSTVKDLCLEAINALGIVEVLPSKKAPSDINMSRFMLCAAPAVMHILKVMEDFIQLPVPNEQGNLPMMFRFSGAATVMSDEDWSKYEQGYYDFLMEFSKVTQVKLTKKTTIEEIKQFANIARKQSKIPNSTRLAIKEKVESQPKMQLKDLNLIQAKFKNKNDVIITQQNLMKV